MPPGLRISSRISSLARAWSGVSVVSPQFARQIVRRHFEQAAASITAGEQQGGDELLDGSWRSSVTSGLGAKLARRRNQTRGRASRS